MSPRTSSASLETMISAVLTCVWRASALIMTPLMSFPSSASHRWATGISFVFSSIGSDHRHMLELVSQTWSVCMSLSSPSSECLYLLPVPRSALPSTAYCLVGSSTPSELLTA